MTRRNSKRLNQDMFEHSRQCFTTFPNTLKFVYTAMSPTFQLFETGDMVKHGLEYIMYYLKRFIANLFRRSLRFAISRSPRSCRTFPQDLPFHLSSAQTCLGGFLRINIYSTLRPFNKNVVFLKTKFLSYNITTDISHQLN